MKLDLVIHDGREEVVDFARRFISKAQNGGLSVVAKPQNAGLAEAATLVQGPPDMVAAIGGDGTMLAAAQIAIEHGIPIFGFNLGTIGFLTEVEPDDVDRVVDRLAAGEFTTEPRMGITARLGGSVARGLNDVVVEKIDSLRLIHMEVEIDGEPFVTYRADGLIVATPTGSTAYNFSAGGPLVDHSIQALMMTPVASHSLFSRTMVLPPDSVIRVTVRRQRPARISVDKVPLGEADEGEVVEISRTRDPLQFVRFDHLSFARAVNEKFSLG
ncbi:MAG: NAD(+)/NADH kinase [Acidimicrobiia bacterium]